MGQPLIMSFRPDAAQMCLDGRKAMTRRIFKPTYSLTRFAGGVRASVQDNRNGRRIWMVGETCAIKPKRTSKAIGRVLITGLRVENVQDITEEDAKREGVEPDVWKSIAGSDVESYRQGFRCVWDRLNPRGSNSWEKNPLVVVIEIRPLYAQ